MYYLYLLIGWSIIALAIEYYKNIVFRHWINKSITYLIDKKRLDKHLKDKESKYIRDYWLDSYVLYNEPKLWFDKSMEKHIRVNYIEKIIDN